MLKAARFSVKVTLQGIEKVMAGLPFYRRTQLSLRVDHLVSCRKVFNCNFQMSLITFCRINHR